jgi:hypothetical protein
VAAEVKRSGTCELSVPEIAARAGVCVRTVQNAVAESVRLGHLYREERECKGRPNLTNVLRIANQEWLTWLRRGPMTGCKEWSATESVYKNKKSHTRFSGCGPRVAHILRVSG